MHYLQIKEQGFAILCTEYLQYYVIRYRIFSFKYKFYANKLNLHFVEQSIIDYDLDL